MMNQSKNLSKLLILFGFLSLTGCSEHSDLKEWMDSVKAQAIKKHPLEKVPSVNAMVAYTPPNYVGLHAFSPERLRAGRQTGINGPNLNRPKEILEAFGLEKIEYVGSIIKAGKTLGFVRVDGHIYTVHNGNYLGQDYGRIAAIEPDRIVLQELVEETDGSWQYREGSIARSDNAETSK